MILRLLMGALLALPLSALAVDDLPPLDKTGGIDLRDEAVIARGLELLNTTCGGYCHGTGARGFKAPSLRNRTDLPASSLYATISFGRKRAGKMMPAWKGVLPDRDIWSAVAGIVSLRDAPVDPDAPKPAAAH